MGSSRPARGEPGERDVGVRGQGRAGDDDAVVMVDGHGVRHGAVRERRLDAVVTEERVEGAGMRGRRRRGEREERHGREEREPTHVRSLRARTLRDDLGDGELQDVRGAGRLQLGDQRVHQPLLDHGLDGVAAFGQRRDRRRLHRRHHLQDLGELRLRDVQLDEDAPLRAERAQQERGHVVHRRALRRVGRGRAVRDQDRLRLEQRLDDLHPVRAERAAGLRDVDDRVDDLGHLGLGGAERPHDLHVDAQIVEVALGQVHELRGDARARRDLAGAVRHVLVRNRQDHARPVSGAALRVRQRRQHLDVGLGLGDPVLHR